MCPARETFPLRRSHALGGFDFGNPMKPRVRLTKSQFTPRKSIKQIERAIEKKKINPEEKVPRKAPHKKRYRAVFKKTMIECTEKSSLFFDALTDALPSITAVDDNNGEKDLFLIDEKSLMQIINHQNSDGLIFGLKYAFDVERQKKLWLNNTVKLMVSEGMLERQAANRLRRALKVSWSEDPQKVKDIGRNLQEMVAARLTELGVDGAPDKKIREKLAKEFGTSYGSITDAINKIRDKNSNAMK